jgi:hypothetical protein
MRETVMVMRVAMGGAICGGFLGIFGGGILGVVCGIFLGNVAFGLDGAIILGIVLAGAGAVYGGVQGFNDFVRKRPGLQRPGQEPSVPAAAQTCGASPKSRLRIVSPAGRHSAPTP